MTVASTLLSSITGLVWIVGLVEAGLQAYLNNPCELMAQC